MEKLDISIAPDCKELVRLGVLQFANLTCQPKNEALWEQIRQLEEKYRSQFTTPSQALDLLKPARKLYYAIGMEPTRIRPSSEALFRRVIKRKPLYQINSIVDTGNYCSLAYLLPIGLYDVAKIQGKVVIRKGKPGESYPGIGKDEIHLTDRLTVADELGAFGNPSADSMRTSIDLNTRNVLMIIFAPANYPEDKMGLHLDFSASAMLHFHPGGELIRKDILP